MPKYKKSTGEEGAGNEGEDEEGEKKPLSDELSEKTNQLLDYIEKTYLQGVIESDPQGKNIIDKMRLDNTQKVRNKKTRLSNRLHICLSPSSGKGNGNRIRQHLWRRTNSITQRDGRRERYAAGNQNQNQNHKSRNSKLQQPKVKFPTRRSCLSIKRWTGSV